MRVPKPFRKEDVLVFGSSRPHHHHWLMSTMGAPRAAIARVHVSGRRYDLVTNTPEMLERNQGLSRQREGEERLVRIKMLRCIRRGQVAKFWMLAGMLQ